MAPRSKRGAALLYILCDGKPLGLGVLFIASAVLIDQLETAFSWIKAHFELINRISGVFLILIGILMMTGTSERGWHCFLPRSTPLFSGAKHTVCPACAHNP